MPGRSRATLFLMEQLVVILVFAICAAACVRIFVGSYLMAQNSRDVKNALLIAESFAECYKATSGDLNTVGLILGTEVYVDASGGVYLNYDSNLDSCDRSMAAYILSLYDVPDEGSDTLKVGTLGVTNREGRQLVSFTVAVRTGR